MKKNILVLAFTTLMLVGCNKPKEKFYTVTWNNYDGSLLEKDENVKAGTMPSYDGETPTKASDETYDYTFEGWTPTLREVTGNITYTAVYSVFNKSEGYVVADYYNGYYTPIVSWTNGEDLKQQLHDLIRTGYTAIKYDSPNWQSNIDADHVQDSYFALDGVYTSSDIVAANTNKAWQREHAFCASLMTGSLTAQAVKNLGRATDFHNLFAAEASANNSRSNKNYGTADTSSEFYQNRTTNEGKDGYSFDNKNFEPAEKDKGRLARAIFYMGTMYKDDEQDTKNGILMKGLTIKEEYVDYVSGTDCAFAIGNLSTLLDWNKVAVDRLEMQHNVSVQTFKFDGTAQGNRNPFVDYPELVDYVYGSKKDQAGSLKNIKPAAVDLDAKGQEHRYYTIKDANTSFGVGSSFNKDGIVIYDVKKDFTSTIYEGAYTTSLDNYTFTVDDVANGKDNIITVGSENIEYHIDVENSSSMSYTGVLNKTGITNTVMGTPQAVTWEGVKWFITVEGTSGYTLQNVSAGGIKLGSGTKAVTKVIIQTADAKTLDAAFIKATAANKDSSFKLDITVGDETVYTGTVTKTDNPSEYGARFASKTGLLTFTFTGSNAIQFESISYNEVK